MRKRTNIEMNKKTSMWYRSNGWKEQKCPKRWSWKKCSWGGTIYTRRYKEFPADTEATWYRRKRNNVWIFCPTHNLSARIVIKNMAERNKFLWMMLSCLLVIRTGRLCQLGIFS